MEIDEKKPITLEVPCDGICMALPSSAIVVVKYRSITAAAFDIASPSLLRASKTLWTRDLYRVT